MILAILPVFTGLKSACSICYNQGMKKSKYKNTKVTVGGMKFDSKREFERWLELKQLEKAGKIRDLERQKVFVLIDKSDYGRRIVYKCDFSYLEATSGAKIVEDVKSPITQKNPVYWLKKRLLAERYGIVIREVF